MSIFKAEEQPTGHPQVLTPENIGAALYPINNAAKRMRDAGAAAYADGRHALAREWRDERQRLYRLKASVLRKAEADGLALRVGYQIKFDQVHNVTWKTEDEIRTTEECSGRSFTVCESLDDERELEGLDSHGCWAVITRQRETAFVCFELGGFRFHSLLDDFPTESEIRFTDFADSVDFATPPVSRMTLIDAQGVLDTYLRNGGE